MAILAMLLLLVFLRRHVRAQPYFYVFQARAPNNISQ